MVQRAIPILAVVAAVALVFLLPRVFDRGDGAVGVPAIQLLPAPTAEPTPDPWRAEARARRARQRRAREQRRQAARRRERAAPRAAPAPTRAPPPAAPAPAAPPPDGDDDV